MALVLFVSFAVFPAHAQEGDVFVLENADMTYVAFFGTQTISYCDGYWLPVVPPDSVPYRDFIFETPSSCRVSFLYLIPAEEHDHEAWVANPERTAACESYNGQGIACVMLTNGDLFKLPPRLGNGNIPTDKGNEIAIPSPEWIKEAAESVTE